jgi:GT2 family glycosyltransferase
VLSASVIVPTYNRPAALARTLGALRRMDFPADRLEIVVVDSGAAESGTDGVARSHDVRYSRREDRGVAAVRNHGASLASGELLMFVDDDIVVDESNLRRHEAIHLSHDRCLVSGHWEFDRELRGKFERSPLGRYRLAYEDLYNRPAGVTCDTRRGRVQPRTLAAANLSVRASTFWSLDGFDERFPVGAEDQDLTWRAAKAGCLLVYDYDIRVIHNDQHSDLISLCRRQERGATGTVYFARKNPDAPAFPMLIMNGPVRREDSTRAVLRKLSRALLSRGVPLALAHRLVSVVELARPNGGWPLEFLYRAVGGLYVFRGVRRGVQLTSADNWAHAHQAS